MAKPMITDTKGREVRVQLSEDKQVIDLYLGPEKTRHHSKTVRWFAAHRVFDRTNALRFARKITSLSKKVK